MCRRCRRSIDGMECRASHHRNTFTLDGIWSFHKDFHSFPSAYVLEEPSRSSIQPSLLNLVRTIIR